MGMKDQDKKVGYFLERTTRIVKLSFHQAFNKANIDITPEQWVILDSLSKNDGQSQTQLGGKSFKNAPTISRIIDVLSKKNMVERRPVPGDRRIFQIYLKEEGVNVIKKSQPIVAELRAKSWQNLSEADYEHFIRIVNQVFENLEG